MKTRKGFTLVEILIVVVILGILAAIVIPQFTNASTLAKESNLKSNLQTVRAQIELYKLNNKDLPPPVDTFATSMASDSNGICYLKTMPSNPFTGGSTIGTDWLYTVSGYNSDFKAGPDTTTDSDKHQTW
jgi:type II secretion system protein G